MHPNGRARGHMARKWPGLHPNPGLQAAKHRPVTLCSAVPSLRQSPRLHHPLSFSASDTKSHIHILFTRAVAGSTCQCFMCVVKDRVTCGFRDSRTTDWKPQCFAGVGAEGPGRGNSMAYQVPPPHSASMTRANEGNVPESSALQSHRKKSPQKLVRPSGKKETSLASHQWPFRSLSPET